MSEPLRERRSERNREPRRHLSDEQAYQHFLREDDIQRQRTMREVETTIEPCDSDEEELVDDEGSASEEEAKAPSNRENIARCSQQPHDLHPPPCSALATVVLPLPRPLLELGYLQIPGLVLRRPGHGGVLRHQNQPVRRRLGSKSLEAYHLGGAVALPWYPYSSRIVPLS